MTKLDHVLTALAPEQRKLDALQTRHAQAVAEAEEAHEAKMALSAQLLHIVTDAETQIDIHLAAIAQQATVNTGPGFK